MEKLRPVYYSAATSIKIHLLSQTALIKMIKMSLLSQTALSIFFLSHRSFTGGCYDFPSCVLWFLFVCVSCFLFPLKHSGVFICLPVCFLETERKKGCGVR